MSAKKWTLVTLIFYFITILADPGKVKNATAPLLDFPFAFHAALLAVFVPWLAMIVARTSVSGVWGLFILSLFANAGAIDTLGHNTLKDELGLTAISLVFAIAGHWMRRGTREDSAEEEGIEEVVEASR